MMMRQRQQQHQQQQQREYQEQRQSYRTSRIYMHSTYNHSNSRTPTSSRNGNDPAKHVFQFPNSSFDHLRFGKSAMDYSKGNINVRNLNNNINNNINNHNENYGNDNNNNNNQHFSPYHHHHISVIFAFLLMILVYTLVLCRMSSCAGLSIWNSANDDNEQEDEDDSYDDEDEQKRFETPTERRSNLCKHFEQYNVEWTVQPHHFSTIHAISTRHDCKATCSASPSSTDTTKSDDPTPTLTMSHGGASILHVPKQSNANNHSCSCKSRIGPNDEWYPVQSSCVICLEVYQDGDILVRSTNPNCNHVFHKECILNYLQNHYDKSTPCPCCRQEFAIPVTTTFFGTRWKNQRFQLSLPYHYEMFQKYYHQSTLLSVIVRFKTTPTTSAANSSSAISTKEHHDDDDDDDDDNLA